MPNSPLSWDECRDLIISRKQQGQKAVFTNGCFDLLHVGHVSYLELAAAEGDLLVIGLNSDDSVRRLKSAKRPIIPQVQRAEVLGSLSCVDAVVIFDQDTPLELITHLQPDVLVKGGDWSIDKIVGREIVQAAGGKVLNIPYIDGISTSQIIERILELNS